MFFSDKALASLILLTGAAIVLLMVKEYLEPVPGKAEPR